MDLSNAGKGVSGMDLDRISTCNYPIRDKDLDYALGLFTGIGFRKVDLWGGLPNFSLDPAECDVVALRQKAEAYGIRIANLGTYPGRCFLSDDEDEVAQEMAEMRRAIDIAVEVGARSIRVSPGKGEDPSIVPALVPLFQESAEYAEERGVYLGIENHKGSIAGDPELCAELVQEVDSRHFGVLFEPANLMHAGVDHKEAYERFRGMVTHVHIKDSHWCDDEYSRTMLGEGDVDLRWVVDELTVDGYAGDFALEYEIEKTVPIEEGLPKWLETFRAL